MRHDGEGFLARESHQVRQKMKISRILIHQTCVIHHQCKIFIIHISVCRSDGRVKFLKDNLVTVYDFRQKVIDQRTEEKETEKLNKF